MERIDEHLPVHVKNERFVARHYKHILISSMGLSFISVVFAFVSVIKANATAQKQAEVIKNMANKVVFVRADGKVAVLEKEDLSQRAVEVALRDIVLNSMLISAFDFYYNNVGKIEDSINIPKVKKLFAFFDKNALRQFIAFVETIFMSYKANNLPEIMITPDVSQMYQNLEYDGVRFIYRVSVPVLFQYVQAQQWRMGKGDVQFYLKGYVDMSRSSPENPLGIYITQVVVEKYVQKP